MPALLWKTGLDAKPALVGAGSIVTEEGDVAAASGSRVFLFVPSNGEYRLYSDLDLQADVSALAVGSPGPEGGIGGFIAAATPERIILLGGEEGDLAVLAQTGPEPGAGFADITAGDLDGDLRDEIVAAAPGQEAIYVYSVARAPGGRLRLDLVGIRVVPGVPRFVRVAAGPGLTPFIAVAYERDGTSGVALYSLTEEGFEAGPVLEELPFTVTALAAGNFAGRPGPELALGGSAGQVWLIGTGERLEVLVVTDVLGASVTALAASGDETSRLMAGTPGGYVFVFNYPVGESPDLAFSVGEGVSSLAPVSGDRAVAGTARGEVQVWSLNGGGAAVNYIVKPGDTLWSIAGKFGVPVERVISFNEGIKNTGMIMPGQVIKVPAP